MSVIKQRKKGFANLSLLSVTRASPSAEVQHPNRDKHKPSAQSWDRQSPRSIHTRSTSPGGKGLAALLVKAKEIAPVQSSFPVATQEICSEMEGMTRGL